MEPASLTEAGPLAFDIPHRLRPCRDRLSSEAHLLGICQDFRADMIRVP